MNTLSAVRDLRITGICAQIEEPLEYSLLIELSAGGAASSSVLFRRKEKPVGDFKLNTPLNLHQGSVLTIKIQEKHRIRQNKVYAPLKLSPQVIWLGQDQTMDGGYSKKFKIHLDDPKKKVWLNLDVPSPAPRSASNTDHENQSVQAIENMSSAQEQTKDPLKISIDNAVDSLTEFRTILDKVGQGKHFLDTGLKFGTILSELHPIAKAVLGFINIAFENINAQDQGHKDILALAKSMARTVGHIRSVERIAQLDQLKETLNEFPSLMQETTDFIEVLVKQSVLASFVLTSNNKDKIHDLRDRHAIFMQEFDRGTIIDQADKIHALTQSQDLKELQHCLLKGNEIVDPQAKECIEGTRKKILAEVSYKIDNLNGANTIWISGAPGSGKSSISLTAKSRLRRQGRLITYFRFDRTQAATTTTNALWCHVGCTLADRYPSVLQHSLSLLRDKKLDRTSSTMDLFTSLIEEPLSKLTDPGPVSDHPLVVVIDALDECGGRDGRSSSDRQELAKTLERWSKLPKQFKLLVTSREEDDINRVLSSNCARIHIPSGHLVTDDPVSQASIDASEDIRTYLAGRFRRISERLSLDQDWPGDKTIAAMVERAAGNFTWAVTTTDFIDSGLDPDERLERIMMASAPWSGGMGPLYSLYTTILETSFGNINDNSDVETIRAILGTVVLARWTLSDEEYTKLPTPKPIRRILLRSIRDCLMSVIVKGSDLRFVHKSFDDYLLSDACLPGYRIRPAESEHLLTKLCLKTMNEELRFNMCNLETSCLKNVNVPGIGTKIMDGISTLLSYSSCFWADHLSHTPLDKTLVLEVSATIRDKLLYWIEAMSLLKEMNRVSHALLLALYWFRHESDEEFKDFLRDSRRFIGAFIPLIAESAAHIYVSALPFTPEHSLISKYFLPRFSRTFALPTGKPTNWSPCIFTSESQKTTVRSIAFSPDEKCFASGSDSGTIFICDSETGNIISGPFGGSDWALRVFFDSDGQRVWAHCRDGQVIGWDVKTGNRHLAFDLGTSDEDLVDCCCYNGGPNIVSVSSKRGTVTLWSGDTGKQLQDLPKVPIGGGHSLSFSPDGGYISWAETGGTGVRIWRLVDGTEIQGRPDSQGHTKPISALSFSTNGTCVVSGSQDGTILIWDTKSGNIVGRPLATDKGRVIVVAYSHEKNLLISASAYPFVVMVWNTSTHDIIFGSLGSRALQTTTIVLSHNGPRALSASWEGTVRMWDLDRRGFSGVSHAIDDHTSGGHTSVAAAITFSLCGKQLASLGWDGTIQVFDTSTGKPLQPLLGPIKPGSNKTGIFFSFDGSLIAVDGQVLKVWDVGTGETVVHQDVGQIVCHYLGFQCSHRRLVICSRNGVIHVWKLEKGIMTEDLSASSPQPEVASEHVKILALSPDGLTALVCDKNRHPPHYFWNITTSQSVPLISSEDKDFSQAKFSPSGMLLATTHVKRLRVWDVQTGELAVTAFTLNGPVACLIFSPDDCHIAITYYNSDSIWLFDARTGNVISATWKGHIEDTITTLAFSADGKRFVSGSLSGPIRIWNTADLVGSSQSFGGILGNGVRAKDGWIMAENRDILLWVPKDHRGQLSWNQNEIVIGGSGARTQLDLTRFRYGDRWAECFGADE